MRDGKKTERERSILSSAEILLNEKPGRDITMQDIADGAGLAVGTLYNYFPSKQLLFRDLLFRALSEMLSETQDFLNGITAPEIGHIKDLLMIMVSRFGCFSRTVWLELMNWAAEQREISTEEKSLWSGFEKAKRPIVKLVETLKKNGCLKDETDPEILSRTLFYLFYVHLREYFYSDRALPDIGSSFMEEVNLIIQGAENPKLNNRRNL